MNGYYTGKISSIDKQNGKVKVTFPQESDVVSSWLPLLAFEYNMPDIGDFVAVILDDIPTVKNHFQLKNMQRRLEMYL